MSSSPLSIENANASGTTNTGLDNWVQHRFQKSPFSSVHTKNETFPKVSVFKVSTSEAFLKVAVFGGNDSSYSPFTCGRKAKKDKKHELSYENAYVWTRPE